MIVEINDMTTPMLSAISRVSREVAFEHMSKIGNTVRKNAGKRMRSSKNRHHWLQKPDKNGVLKPYYSTETKEFGQRTKRDGKTVANPPSMGNMISSFMMEKSGVLIVGGKNKAFTPIRRRDGEIVGVEKRQGAITAHTQSIIHKLDTGERNSAHHWLNGQGKYFEHWKFRGRHFMIKGFGDSIPYMKSELTSGYERTVGRAVNKVKVKLKPSKRVVA